MNKGNNKEEDFLNHYGNLKRAHTKAPEGILDETIEIIKQSQQQKKPKTKNTIIHLFLYQPRWVKQAAVFVIILGITITMIKKPATNDSMVASAVRTKGTAFDIQYFLKTTTDSLTVLADGVSLKVKDRIQPFYSSSQKLYFHMLLKNAQNIVECITCGKENTLEPAMESPLEFAFEMDAAKGSEAIIVLASKTAIDTLFFQKKIKQMSIDTPQLHFDDLIKSLEKNYLIDVFNYEKE